MRPRSDRGIVLLVLACLVRAVVPIEAAGRPVVVREDVRPPVAATSAFACEHHQCGCRSEAECRRECCCSAPTRERLEEPRTGGPRIVLSKCQGGDPHSLPATAGGWVAVLPRALAVLVEPRAVASIAAESSWSPGPALEPLTPPPRRGISTV